MHRARLSAVLFLSILLSALATAHAASYTFTTIDPYRFTHAHGINNSGQIMGLSGPHGFLWDGTNFTPIDVPGAPRPPGPAASTIAARSWGFSIMVQGSVVF
jgi:hypothetical protein